jgi:hypothetical protein
MVTYLKANRWKPVVSQSPHDESDGHDPIHKF